MQHDPSQIIAPREVFAGTDSAADTLFPALDGASPGQQDAGQNLGEYPFGAPLHGEDSLPLADTSSGVVSPAEVQRQSEELPASNASILEGASAAVPPGNTSVSNRKRSAEERINQLTARWRSTETENSALQNQVAQLTQMIGQMQMQQSAQSSPRAQYGSGEASPSDPNPFAVAGGGSAPGVDANSLRRIIEESVAPLAQTVTGLVQANQRKALHEVSFARAVEDFPELAKPGSEARAVFDKLYANHGLAAEPDGPEQIAVMVRGILAGARRDSQTVSQRKVAASVQVPTPSASDDVVSGQPQTHQIEQARRELLQRMRSGDRSFETYRALRGLPRTRSQAGR